MHTKTCIIDIGLVFSNIIETFKWMKNRCL